MPERISEYMPERMSDKMPEYIYIYNIDIDIDIQYIYIQMVCRNNVSGCGSLEESNSARNGRSGSSRSRLDLKVATIFNSPTPQEFKERA
jgi:hypothetical protein